jgi:hypothetical protein
MRWIGSHILFAVLVAGCIRPVPGPVAPVDPVQPEPVVLTPELAAARFADDYRQRLAVVAGDVATKAESGQFEDLSAVNDAWVTGSKDAREQAQVALIRAMNKALTDSKGKPGTEAAALFRQLESGFRKGGAK